jgi:ketosteroid isomerase-like protein
MNTQPNKGLQLLENLLAAFNEGADNVVKLFNDDAVIEYPYAPSLGTVSRLDREGYYHYLKGALPNMPNLNFSGVKVYPVTGDNAYWAEVHCEAVIPSTGKHYEQDYVMYFTVKDNRFHLYREYWNPIPGLKAFGGDSKMHEVFNDQIK